MSVRDLIIIGAGPSGLSAAIAATRHNLDYLVVEQGTLVNSIYRFPPQMVFFTTPELLEIGGLPFITPYDKPTRPEALRYYRRVVDTFDLRIAFEETVLSVTPETPDSISESTDPVFALETRTARGVRRVRHARFVVFAIGYFDRPNMLGIPGEDLPHVTHYYREPYQHYRQRVAIVGGGNSAAEAALELYRAGAHVTLVHRGAALKPSIKYWVRPDIENRIKEGSVAARFNATVVEIRPTSIVIETQDPSNLANPSNPSNPSNLSNPDPHEELSCDAVYLLTGYRADSALMTGAGVQLTERDAPLHDPQTFETNVRGVFVAGGAIAGVDTGLIFIENGRFHGEKLVEEIARRMAG